MITIFLVAVSMGVIGLWVLNRSAESNAKVERDWHENDEAY